ncbi:T9SS type A sorting domain-containing protein [Taibaiella soli]|uniref:Secretion system C-terminal sorting domain-containing protein n=1 Tax=Taibaiella soli TaxID=1649169 RepID=A0A2W2ADC6_9BACT|nr:T9SS type A sorting domain-containing protein [Taibaiella soli]PZF71642.1 hypothetical protein DN068_16360 [Taibaiella soli]
MRKHFRTPFRKMAVALLPVALAACISNSSHAQDFVKTFRSYDDLKQYTILPVENNDEYVMAGTLENRAVHFIHVGGMGNMLANEYYRDPLGNYEHHTTNLVAYSDNEYIITSLRRDVPVSSTSRDVLELYFVKGDGSLLDHRIIQNTQAINGTNYTNIYPMHSLINNDTLYITGFVSNQPITDPTSPSFRGITSKQIFVMRYNINTNTVMTSKVFDFVYTPASVAYFDADMGVNLTLTSSGTLYVTGSANAIQPIASASTYNIGAGTLNLALNPNTLAVQNTGNTSFIADYYTNPFTYGEYGVALMEDQVNGGYNVVSNSADYFKYGLLNIAPKSTMITHINSSFNIYATPAKSRMRVKDPGDGAWSLEAMESADGNDHILLGGMQTMPLPNCSGNAAKPSPDNFNPFLADLTLGWDASSSTLSATLNTWRTYLCQFGTGNMSMSNSYFLQGGNFAYNAWNPVFATRRQPIGSSFTDDIMMTAPSWNPDYNALNLKLIRTDKNGDISSCPDAYTNCATAGLTPEQVNNTLSYGSSVSVSMTNSNYAVSTTQVQADPGDWGPYAEIYCEPSAPYFRKANVTNVQSAITASLTPNPAINYVNVSLQGIADGNTTVRVELTDITGKSAGVLYNGTADGLNSNTKLKLPTVASGLYLVKISAGTQMLPIQKLVITE